MVANVEPQVQRPPGMGRLCAKENGRGGGTAGGGAGAVPNIYLSVSTGQCESVRVLTRYRRKVPGPRPELTMALEEFTGFLFNFPWTLSAIIRAAARPKWWLLVVPLVVCVSGLCAELVGSGRSGRFFGRFALKQPRCKDLAPG